MATKNANLHNAKTAKNDEFYTQLTDVEKELMHYKKHFENKIVLCNCDDTWSSFWTYFHKNFHALKLKKLICTHYVNDGNSFMVEYFGGNDNDLSAIGIRTELTGNGDFRSEECLRVLDESDIVVTNPPFSLFREFVATLVEHNKQFLILGNKNAITYKELFPMIKNNEMWLGYNSPADFIQPNTDVKKQMSGLTRWFTNLDISKRHEELILWKKYNEEEYPKYDNYDAINVDKVADIPVDYMGVMGVPITFLDKFNPEQFEIVSFRKGEDGKDLIFTRERERIQPYFRILVRPRLRG